MLLYLYASNRATVVAGATELLEQFLQFTGQSGLRILSVLCCVRPAVISASLQISHYFWLCRMLA